MRVDAVTYARVARALWWGRLPEHAWQLHEQMEASSVPADVKYYETVIAAAESVGLLDDADRLHRHAAERGLAPPPRPGKPK